MAGPVGVVNEQLIKENDMFIGVRSMFLDKAKSARFWETVRTNPKYRFMIDEVLEEYNRVAN